MKRALLIHGWTNRRPEGHWLRRLAGSLRDQGNLVQYPQLPDTDSPTLDAWCEVLSSELELLHESGEGETVVVAHSLGCVTWLHLCQRGLVPSPIDRVLLVAPAAPETITDLPSFAVDVASARESLMSASLAVTVVASDDDPYLPRGVQETYGEPLGVNAVIIPGAAHLALGDGWGPWQGVIDWVADPAADLRQR